ncbi:carboxylesterase family protein [Roseimaritima ulvae]|uniref:Esterase n=1 Tax=Roseimaritima ulvae TaxID=980254 RepID=A0A5B9QM38_9BACT|nr:prolyl oligopeptidase family serine peptidase [Roseimaritima ulvae]QEG38680.1 esterase [Roseimaritima ulvae]
MKTTLYLFATTLLLMLPPNANAQDALKQFEARQYSDADGNSLSYRILKPKQYDPAKKYPLVMFWHGAGERGDDNQRQLVHGMADFASAEVMEKYPAFVVAPQCPKNQKWANNDWSADQHTMSEQPSTPMRLSLELIDSLQKEFSIDADRIYVTGLSMGGFGTWDALQRRPKQFAAAIPICGGGDTALAEKIASVPVWVFHGGNDTVVKTSRSRDMVQALKEAGGKPKYTEYPGVGHNSWSATYANPEVYKWLFSQRRSS